MTNPIEPVLQGRIDAYLLRLRHCLSDLAPEDISEILREIRGHIVERAESMNPLNEETLAQFLSGFGRPEDIGSLYQTRAMMARARSSSSPVLILRTVIRWARLSTAGLIACLSGMVGFSFALLILSTAIWKLFDPQHVGLWVSPGGRFSLGMLTLAEQIREQAHDLFGWWLVPLGFIGAPLLCVGTTLLLRWALKFGPAPFRWADRSTR